MKNKLIVLLSIISLMLGMALSAQAGEREPFSLPDMPFDTAVIKYKLDGMTKGKSTLYIKGDTQAVYTKQVVEMMGMKDESEGIVITSPDKMIQVNLKEKAAIETGNPQKYMREEYEKLSDEEKANVRKNSEGMAASILGGMQGGMQGAQGGKTEMKEGEFMGKPCKIIEAMGLTSYIWKDTDIMLKTDGNMMGIKFKQVATSIKTDVSIPDSKFKVPAGIKVVFDKEADRQQRMMAKNMVDMLKDPEMSSKGVSSMHMQAMEEDMANGDEGEEYEESYEEESHSDGGNMSEEEVMKKGMEMLGDLFSN